MPRPHPTQPADPDPDRCWPSCDQEQPGVSIRPLTHADLQALWTSPREVDTGAMRPWSTVAG
jgi:hypothetical protein